MHNSILTYNGQTIEQRADGYVNATQMAQANNVRLDKYFANKSTVLYLQEFEASPVFGGTIPVKTSRDCNSSDFGTWLHPIVAIHFAQWISPSFYFWCNTHLKTLIETGTTQLEQSKPKSLLDGLQETIDILRSQEQKIQFLEQQFSLESAKNNQLKEIVDHHDAELERIFKPDGDYFSVRGYARLLNRSLNISEANNLGRQASKLTKTLGLSKDFIKDPRFGKVGVYPETVLSQVFEQFLSE